MAGFRSKAQMRKFKEMELSGELDPGTYDEWLADTGNPKKLPEYSIDPLSKKYRAVEKRLMDNTKETGILMFKKKRYDKDAMAEYLNKYRLKRKVPAYIHKKIMLNRMIQEYKV